MHIPTSGVLSSFNNINMRSTPTSGKTHGNVETYDIKHLKLTISSLFMVLPKDGTSITNFAQPFNVYHEQVSENISPNKVYDVESQTNKTHPSILDASIISAGMDTVNAVMLSLKSKNYANEFFVNSRGCIILKNEIYQQNEIKLVKIYRFEGDSNPSDEAIIYLIKADSGTFGYSLDGYGISSNHDHDQYVEFIRRLSFQKPV